MHPEPEFSVGKREQIIGVKVRRLIVDRRKISAEKRMLIADLVIHPAQSQVLIGPGSPADLYEAAWICRGRKTRLFQNCKRCRREPRWIDAVVRKTKIRIQRNTT